MKSLPLAVSAALFIWLSPTPAAALTVQKDIAVASKALAFVEPKLSGDIAVGIVHDPAKPASISEAKAIGDMLSTTKVKGVRLKPQLIDVNKLDRLGSARVLFLTDGLARRHNAIFGAASQAGILTISTDMSCVASGNCVVGVRASPRVEIIVSRAARRASDISFGQAFLMLVTEK